MMSNPKGAPLSRGGLTRRDEMLHDLVGVMERTHRARRMRRRVLAAGGSLCVLVLLIALAIPGGTESPDTRLVVESEASDPVPASVTTVVPQRAVVITSIVTTDPSVLDRYRANPSSFVVRMTDKTLLETLASIHRPAGLIRFGGEIRISAPVTDAELGL